MSNLKYKRPLLPNLAFVVMSLVTSMKGFQLFELIREALNGAFVFLYLIVLFLYHMVFGLQ